MRVRPYGRDAVLVEPDDDDAGGVLALAAAARELDGVTEVVPGARTVLVVSPRRDLAEPLAEAPAEALAALDVGTARPARPAEVVLEVRYDGADLAATAAELGFDPDGLVRAHADGRYTVAFCGFSPGFAYLTGLDPALHAVRLPEPRTRVPAGSVGVAGEFTGVYPRASPGGWRLLGTTDALLWDSGREPPALLAPGTPVRFRATP